MDNFDDLEITSVDLDDELSNIPESLDSLPIDDIEITDISLDDDSTFNNDLDAIPVDDVFLDLDDEDEDDIVIDNISSFKPNTLETSVDLDNLEITLVDDPFDEDSIPGVMGVDLGDVPKEEQLDEEDKDIINGKNVDMAMLPEVGTKGYSDILDKSLVDYFSLESITKVYSIIDEVKLIRDNYEDEIGSTAMELAHSVYFMNNSNIYKTVKYISQYYNVNQLSDWNIISKDVKLIYNTIFAENDRQFDTSDIADIELFTQFLRDLVREIGTISNRYSQIDTADKDYKSNILFLEYLDDLHLQQNALEIPFRSSDTVNLYLSSYNNGRSIKPNISLMDESLLNNEEAQEMMKFALEDLMERDSEVNPQTTREIISVDINTKSINTNVVTMFKSIELKSKGGKFTCSNCENDTEFEGEIFIILRLTKGNGMFSDEIDIIDCGRTCSHCGAYNVLPSKVKDKLKRHFNKIFGHLNSNLIQNKQLPTVIKYIPSANKLEEVMPSFFSVGVEKKEVVVLSEEEKFKRRLKFIDDYKDAIYRARNRTKKIGLSEKLVAKIVSYMYDDYEILKKDATISLIEFLKNTDLDISNQYEITLDVLSRYNKDAIDYNNMYSRANENYPTDKIFSMSEYKTDLENNIEIVKNNLEEIKKYDRLICQLNISELGEEYFDPYQYYTYLSKDYSPEVSEYIDYMTDKMIINHLAEKFINNFTPVKYKSYTNFRKDTFSTTISDLKNINKSHLKKSYSKLNDFFFKRYGVTIIQGYVSDCIHYDLLDRLDGMLSAIINKDMESLKYQINAIKESPSWSVEISDLYKPFKDIIESDGNNLDFDKFIKDNSYYLKACRVLSGRNKPKDFINQNIGKDILFSLNGMDTTIGLSILGINDITYKLIYNEYKDSDVFGDLMTNIDKNLALMLSVSVEDIFEFDGVFNGIENFNDRVLNLKKHKSEIEDDLSRHPKLIDILTKID